jgi:hypothetical protein
MLRHWLKYPFLVRTDHNGLRAENIVVFDSYLSSMDEHRNNRLNLNRTCLTADMLKERCSIENTPFNELVQADIFMALFGVVQLKTQGSETGFYKFWRPRTAVYSSDARNLPIFLKAIDPDIRHCIRLAVGVASGAELTDAFSEARLKIDNLQHLLVGRMFGFNFEKAINLQSLIE